MFWSLNYLFEDSEGDTSKHICAQGIFHTVHLLPEAFPSRDNFSLCLRDTAPPLGILRYLLNLKDLLSIPLASLSLWSWCLCAASGNCRLHIQQPLLNTLTPPVLSRSPLSDLWPPLGGPSPPSSPATQS